MNTDAHPCELAMLQEVLNVLDASAPPEAD
jgi:hypothetical protein